MSQEYGYQLQLGPIHMGVACTFNNKNWELFYLYQFKHMPMFGINENM